ncbi:MAG: multi antimicrobial extrusion protein [Selenomonadaceae bacterium]|nr:multi antimicrobial extrusion protein [Selenomonadaceae bacterium]
MSKTFCGVRFKKMLLSSILMATAYSLSTTVDFVLAAQLFGDNAMAAVNLVNPIYLIIAFLSSMLSIGTSYRYSFEVGAFHQDNANKLVGQGLILSVTMSILFGAILFFGREVFFSFFDVTGEIEAFAREYYSLFFIAVAITPIYFLMYIIVFADGGGKNGVIATCLSVFVNIAASIVLGIKFGIAGIAFGTFLGYFSAIAVFAKWFFIDSQTLKPILYFSASKILQVLKLSYVHASFFIYFGFGNMILNAFFLKTFGAQNFPILSVVMGLLQFSLFLLGLANATEPLINVYLGEKNFDGIKKVMTISIKSQLLFGAVLIPIVFVFSANIAELFGIGDAIFGETVFAIRAIGFSMPFISLLYLFTTYYQIRGYMKTAISLAFCKDFGFYLLIPMILGLNFGLEGFFIGMMSASIASCVIFAIFLRVRYGKRFPLLLEEADIVSRDAKLNLERVLELRDWAEAKFSKRGFNSKVTRNISLIIEEVGMSIVENNPNNEPLAELTLIFGEEIKIIIRDNGKHFDLTDEAVNSFRSFFIYSFLEGSGTARSYLTTQNYNRHIFTLIK